MTAGRAARFVFAWLDAAPWLRTPRSTERCIMGSPVGPAVWCHRRSHEDGLFCARHARFAARFETRRG